MENEVEINAYGNNVYLTFFVKAHIAGKVILSIFVLFLIALLFYVLMTISEEGIQKYFLGILVYAALIVFFPLKYLLWNLFGKEHLIVNTKTISYNYSYGLYTTNLKTKEHYKLGLSFDPDPKQEDKVRTTLHFITQDKETELPEILHSTAVLIDPYIAKQIHEELSKLFTEEVKFNMNYSNISLN